MGWQGQNTAKTRRSHPPARPNRTTRSPHVPGDAPHASVARGSSFCRSPRPFWLHSRPPPAGTAAGLRPALPLEGRQEAPRRRCPCPAVSPPSPRSASSAPRVRGAHCDSELALATSPAQRSKVPWSSGFAVCIERRRRWCRLLTTSAARSSGRLGSSAAAALPSHTAVAPAASTPSRLWPSQRCLVRRGKRPPTSGRPEALRPHLRVPAVAWWPRPTSHAPRAAAQANSTW